MNGLIYLDGLYVMLALAGLTWLVSIALRDVSIVDSAWSMMFLSASIAYLVQSGSLELKNIIILLLIAAWAIRLSVHLMVRNWGQPEDRRYQAIREKYSPYFPLKSLFVIFIFQAVLAWLVSAPLFAALTSTFQPSSPAYALFAAGLVLWLVGFVIETVADWQLARFKNKPANHGNVMDRGLWRYSRHPNYFGECIIWWGFFLIALSTGAWWSIIAPVIMTWLLLKFSGVVMLEETITERRPAYRDYIKKTNAFIPGPVKSVNDCIQEQA